MSRNFEFRAARWMAKEARRLGFEPGECRRIEADTRAHVVALLGRGCPRDAVRVRWLVEHATGELVVQVEPAEGVEIAPEVAH